MTVYKCTQCGFTVETEDVINFDSKCPVCMEEGGYTSARRSYMKPIE